APLPAGIEAGYYAPGQFYDDLMAVTEGQADPALSEVMVRESTATLKWLAGHGLRFHLAGARWPVGKRPSGTTTAPTGSLFKATGEGPELSEMLFAAVERCGIS